MEVKCKQGVKTGTGHKKYVHMHSEQGIAYNMFTMHDI